MERLINDLVSIITPVYNGEKYIDRCINSVIFQTYKNIEFIIIDDGSTDKTVELIEKRRNDLEGNLKLFKLIRKNNGGVASAVNEGLKYMTGEFISLYDVDDILMPDHVSTVVKVLKENESYSCVQSNGYFVTEENLSDKSCSFAGLDYNIQNNDLFDLLIKGKTFNFPGSYMIRTKDWIQGNSGREIYCSRSGQNMQMLMPATYHKKSLYLNRHLMKYLVHSQSLSHFTGHDAYIKEMGASKNYQNIYVNVIKKICNKKEHDHYLKIVEETFNRSRMNIAIRYDKVEDIKKYYNLLKENNVLTYNDQVNYWNKFNKLYLLIIKVMYRLGFKRN